MKKLKVTVEGKTYEVTVEILSDEKGAAAAPAAPAHINVSSAAVSAPVTASTAPPASKPGPATPGDVVSPLAGRVISIDVKVGQQIAEGAQVFTLEAMKMNTLVFAPQAGTVTAIKIAPGDAVEEGQGLVTVA